VLWWAAHHRTHHSRSDREGDIHSPARDGFLHSHFGWILTREHDETDIDKIPDFARYPELRWLNRHYLAPFVTLCVALFLAGGWSWLVWGGFLSTVFVWHVTFSINSVAHLFGWRRFPTRDGSRNNLILALLTGGEGWHNNHHHYPNSVNQGFYRWEIDWTYGVLRFLALFGIVRDLRRPPERVLRAGRS
jgi:stearoyl-CoA desaturase (delta-9 desaturase)